MIAMKMTMAQRDIKAIENGMKKYNVDSKGLLEIVNKWVEDYKEDKGKSEYELLLHFQECVKTYIQWG